MFAITNPNFITMKKKLKVLGAAVFMLALFSECELVKVKLMHKGKMIEVSKNAYQTHLDHGDTPVAGIYKLEDGTMVEYPVIINP